MSALTDSTNTIQPEAETVGKPIVEEVKKAEDVTPVENVAVVEVAEASVENTDVKETKESEAVAAEVSGKAEEKAEEKTDDAVKDSEAVTAEAEHAEDAAMETEEAEEADVTADETAEVEETKEEKEKRFEETLIAGRRFMKTSAFNQATESLSVVAALAEELYGSEHEKTFDVLLVYGQALLELAKMEDGVLNNALSDMPKAAEGEEEPEDGVVENPDNVPEEERADIKHKVEEALGVAEPETIAEVAEEAAEKMEEATATEKIEGEVATKTAIAEPSGDVEMETEQPGAEATEATETAETAEAAETGEAQEDADAEAETDDDDTMKLAWEILETARLNCEARIKKLTEAENADVEIVKVWRLNNADVLTTLGEHGLADSKYPQAQEDLKKALAIQQELLPVTSRIIANTFHLIGKAFAADELFVEAEKQFTSAKDILTAKVDELKKQLEGADEEKTNEINAEVKELEGVIPEIQLLIEDARLTEVQRQELKAEAAKLFDAVAADKEKLSAVETTDISNLVRRPAKRPAEETEKAEEAKKRKSEDGSATIPETTQTTGESETAPAPVTVEE